MMRQLLGALLCVACALGLLASGAAAQDPPPLPMQLRDEAFQSAQKAMLTSAGMALAQLGARFAAGSDDLARLVRQRQDLVAAWKSTDRALVKALGAAGAGGDPETEKLRAQAEALEARIVDSDRDMAARFPAYAELSQPQPLSIAATQALLRDDEALVMVFVGTRETFVWGVTRDDALWHRVPERREDLVAKVKALRSGLDPGAVAVTRSVLRDFGDTDVEGEGIATSARVGFSRAVAHELFRQILAPLDPLLAQRRRVFVVAERPFDSLPFALLVTEPPRGADTDPADLRETAWLIRRQGIVTLPSVSSLKSLRSGASVPAAPLPFRGYGAPLLGGRSAPMQVAAKAEEIAGAMLRGGRVSLETVRSLAPLPQTEGELRRLAEALGAPSESVQVGAAATKSAVMAADLSRYRVLAFATHGLLAGDVPGLSEPALVFTPPAEDGPDDGLLTASEAARLNLAADWVILSACNTAGGDGTPGADGLSGLARAFFYAGARTLLVSHWPVRDDAAARLTTGTLAALRADPGLAKAEAFRRATLALIADPSDPTLAHPAIWAPFVMVGEGR